MNQSARPGAPSATPDRATTDSASHRVKRVGAAMLSRTGAWTAAVTQFMALTDKFALIRPELAAFALPPILAGLGLLFVHGATILWDLALLVLLSSFFAMTGIGALTSGQRDTRTIPARVWPATSIGFALLAVAALCALPVALTGAASALVLVGLGASVVALYALAPVRRRIAPLDELIGPLCLGPGLVSLTLVSEGQSMSAQDWLVASALGCMTLAVIEARHLRIVDEELPQRPRTLMALLGRRSVTLLTGAALVASFALMAAIGVLPQGLPGALVAITALPITLLGLSGLFLSQFAPARESAARQIVLGYYWFGLTLAAGMTFTVISQYIVSAIVQALGG